ncbi:MAG: aldo/keto reductase [Bacilli bacterium]|nr:aldo/keto reductase [Bacilli bacterium]
MEKVVLNNGVVMPTLGIGTFLIEPPDAFNGVKEALKMGYRHIDTANMYGNERAVGRAIKESGVPRNEIFLATKIWPTEYHNPNIVEETLERLGVDYVDLLYVHQPAGDWKACYKMIEKAYKEGKTKAIGISNMEGHWLDELYSFCEIKPQVIQVECHPYFPQTELREQIKKDDIKIVSWFPLGHGDPTLLNQKVIGEIAKKHEVTNAQVLLRWQLDMGFTVIPGSKNVDHIRDNYEILSFSLDKEDMDKIATLNNGKKYNVQTPEKLEIYANRFPVYEKE